MADANGLVGGCAHPLQQLLWGCEVMLASKFTSADVFHGICSESRSVLHHRSCSCGCSAKEQYRNLAATCQLLLGLMPDSSVILVGVKHLLRLALDVWIGKLVNADFALYDCWL
jgi:hypothetical protein